MSLVTLSSQQYQGGFSAKDTPDVANFTTSFSEPLTIFPGQEVQLVSFSYALADSSYVSMLHSPDMMILVPELHTRTYNATRQTVNNAVAFVPSTELRVIDAAKNKAPAVWQATQKTTPLPIIDPANQAPVMVKQTVFGGDTVRLQNVTNVSQICLVSRSDIPVHPLGADAQEILLAPSETTIIRKLPNDTINVYNTPPAQGDLVTAEPVTFVHNNLLGTVQGFYDTRGNNLASSIDDDVNVFPQSYVPPQPQILRVNVPSTRKVNQLTCQITLPSGKLVSKFGGIQAENPKLFKATVTYGGAGYTAQDEGTALFCGFPDDDPNESIQLTAEIKTVNANGQVTEVELTAASADPDDEGAFGRGYFRVPQLVIPAPSNGGGSIAQAAFVLANGDYLVMQNDLLPFLKSATVTLRLSAPPDNLAV